MKVSRKNEDSMVSHMLKNSQGNSNDLLVVMMHTVT